MTWMDLKSISIDDLRRLRNEFEAFLEDIFPAIKIDIDGNAKKCFQLDNGDLIYPAFMFGGKNNTFHCLVIEYAGDADELIRSEEEEGAQFFPEDYESKEAMFEAMLKEIEG